MAEASPANGLDLEKLVAGAKSGSKLATADFEKFETLARAVGERLTAYKAAIETYFGYTANAKDFTFVRRSHGQNVEQVLVGDAGNAGMLSTYEQLLQFGEQHAEGATSYVIFELLKSYAKYTARLVEGFYPESFGKDLVTGTGEIEVKEAARRKQRQEFFGMLATNMLDKDGVDYKFRELLGENFERWNALEEKLSRSNYGSSGTTPVSAPRPGAPTGTPAIAPSAAPTAAESLERIAAVPVQEIALPVAPTLPAASGSVAKGQVYTILYDSAVAPEALIGLEQFAKKLWDIAGVDEKDKYGGPGLTGFRQFMRVTGEKIGRYCSEQKKDSVDCTIAIDPSSKKAKVRLQ